MPSRTAGKRPPTRFRRAKGEACPGCGYLVCQCLELALLAHIKARGLPAPIREYQFALPRQFRADMAYPGKRLLIEVEGGGPRGHHSGDGYDSDCEKYNIAALLGWTVLRFTGRMIEKGYRGLLAVDVVAWALENILDDPDAGTEEAG